MAVRKSVTREEFAAIQEAAEYGDAAAQRRLGEIYRDGLSGKLDDRNRGIDEECDDVLSAHWYRRAADQGDAEARYQIGRLWFYDGWFGDRARGFELFRMAAEQGHAEAQEELACLYEDGVFVERDPAAAWQWRLRAAENGSNNARQKVADALLYGDDELGVEEDVDAAIHWLRIIAAEGEDWNRGPAADTLEVLRRHGPPSADADFHWHYLLCGVERGDSAAMFRMGEAYFDGDGHVGRDSARAEEWYLKAADHGDSNAIVYHAFCHLRSRPARKAEWCRMAAERGQGGGEAEFILYILHRDGRPGVPQDTDLAMRWLRQACERGYEHGYSTLAWHLLGGRDVEQDIPLGLHWMEMSANGMESDDLDGGDAEAVCGRIHLHGGGGVRADRKRAAYWFRRSARRRVPFAGFVDAEKNGWEAVIDCFRLRAEAEWGMMRGFMGACDPEIERVPPEAIQEIRAAMELGSPAAFYVMGMLADRGCAGVPKDHERSFDLVLKAAGMGFPDACRRAADCYRYGWGVCPDSEDADFWDARANGDGEAEDSADGERAD